jgi:hypothetical protein
MKEDGNSTQSQKPTSFIQRHKVGLIIASVVVLLIVLAYGIPPVVGDGMGRFSGVKKRVAQEALRYRKDAEDPMSRAVHGLDAFQFYVEDIKEMSPQEVKNCKLKPSDDGTGYYHVYISHVSLFGLRFNTTENFYGSCYASEKTKNNP